MPNKEISRSQGPVTEPKMAASPAQPAPVKAPGATSKVNAGKGVREAMSPPAEDPDRTELLGSLTTEQQQRTSARVIKKLRLEPLAPTPAGKGKSETECETPSKIDEKDLKFPTVKQRMPKALWSTDEKNLFFEALNEYGKEFDAITAYICAKMKKKGMPDGNLKTKTQVSHFYYRTWHKLSKHVHFDENVKKVAQELYALINYGELRRKLVAVKERTCARLGEMVLGGSLVVRARGRNLRVRTPVCRALRNLNQITGCVISRVCWRCTVVLRARSSADWARVHAAAHNPRLQANVSTRTKLSAFIRALERRWAGFSSAKLERISESSCAEEGQKETDDGLERACEEDDRDDVENHLNLETDRLILQEQRLGRKPALHVGPHPDAQVHLPLVRASEPMSTHKICLSSYLERVAPRAQGDKAAQSKIRTPKRQRKDSSSEKDKEIDSKKLKLEESDGKLINIDETAIDGIELMASFKSQLDDEEKPSAEDEKDLKSEETAEEEVENKDLIEKDIMLERDKDMCERESFSDIEEDDYESDHGKEKNGKEGKFSNLKVKFRIRPKKSGGSMYSLVLDKEQEEPKVEEQAVAVELETAARQVRRGWSRADCGELTLGDLYLMFGSRSRLELDYWWAEPTPPLPRASLPITPPATERDGKTQRTPDKEDEARESDTDIFSPKAFGHDSNDGLSGDERKGEQLASPEHKPPAPSAPAPAPPSCGASLKLATKLVNRPAPAAPAPPGTRDSGFSQLSDRLKRLLALAGNPHVSGAGAACATSRCGCGHVCPPRRQPPAPPHALPHAQPLQKPHPSLAAAAAAAAARTDDTYSVFRHPTPIAPRPDSETQKALSLEGLPPLARGRRRAERRVVVQRLLPLLPKLPPAVSTNLIPVKIVPPSGTPRLLPKPAPVAPAATSERQLFYVLSESNGQFYFHDGDKRIPITPPPGMAATDSEDLDEDSDGAREDKASDARDVTLNQNATKEEKTSESRDVTLNQSLTNDDIVESSEGKADRDKAGNTDIANFLPSESMSLSPSRLLRDSDTWLGSVQDFSLSSFLHQLETRQELGVDSQLQSLMAESSVDYVAKFADLAAEVSGEPRPSPSNEMP